MIIKNKYPSLDRPFMQTRFQGYGSGLLGNVGSVANENTEHSVIAVSTNTWSKPPVPPAPPAVYKVFRLQNFGGNRDAGNDFLFTNWDGVSIEAFTGNNGADSVVAVLGGTEGSIVINGDTHFFAEEFSSESRSAAQALYDGVEIFNLGDGYGGASGW